MIHQVIDSRLCGELLEHENHTIYGLTTMAVSTASIPNCLPHTVIRKVTHQKTKYFCATFFCTKLHDFSRGASNLVRSKTFEVERSI